jgi:predicted negative regulator of RcsB-dependent stress response
MTTETKLILGVVIVGAGVAAYLYWKKVQDEKAAALNVQAPSNGNDMARSAPIQQKESAIDTINKYIDAGKGILNTGKGLLDAGGNTLDGVEQSFGGF